MLKYNKRSYINMSNYDVLNQPYRICNVEIKNRFTVIPMTMGGLAYDEQGGFPRI